MKIIKNKFNKQDITTLPRSVFSGRIITIESERETEAAVDYLMSQPILGLDTETRPSFTRGTYNKVALLQVATHDTCFLFRLNRIGIPDALLRLLEDQRTMKVGLSLKDDFHQLQTRRKFTIGSFVELQNEVHELGIEDMSLQKIYANIFGKRITKGQQLSNWEADVLTESQKRYAATDAWACIDIHEEIKRLVETHDFELIINDN